MIDESEFNHNPTDSRDIDGGKLASFEKAKEAVENGEGDGLGFAVTRHDPFLVLEIINGLQGDELAPTVEAILDALGVSFTERDDEGLIRVIYRGELPGELHGGDPVVITLGGKPENHVLRFFDTGWTPITGRHISGTPEDVKDVNQDALARILSKAGKYDE